MKKASPPSVSLSSNALQIAKEKLMLEYGCIHLIKMDEKDGLVLPKGKEFHKKICCNYRGYCRQDLLRSSVNSV